LNFPHKKFYKICHWVLAKSIGFESSKFLFYGQDQSGEFREEKLATQD
jgi:hypothetical protein